MKSFFRRSITLLVAISCYAEFSSATAGEISTAVEADRIYPFEIGEKLVYEISYFGITAGHITLEYIDDMVLDSQKMLKIKGEAKTSGLFSLFYKVEDTVNLFIIKDLFKPYRVEIYLNEAGKKRKEEIVYDYNALECRHSRKGKNYRTDIPPDIQDSFSSIYYYRIFWPEEENVLSFNVYASRKVWRLEAPIIRREEIEIPVGKFKSFVVKPVTMFEGAFERKGDVILWFSDDEKRLPLKLEARIKIGSLEGTLVEYRLNKEAETISTLK